MMENNLLPQWAESVAYHVIRGVRYDLISKVNYIFCDFSNLDDETRFILINRIKEQTIVLQQKTFGISEALEKVAITLKETAHSFETFKNVYAELKEERRSRYHKKHYKINKFF